jgi:hypothetical protein
LIIHTADIFAFGAAEPESAAPRLAGVEERRLLEAQVEDEPVLRGPLARDVQEAREEPHLLEDPEPGEGVREALEGGVAVQVEPLAGGNARIERGDALDRETANVEPLIGLRVARRDGLGAPVHARRARAAAGERGGQEDRGEDASHASAPGGHSTSHLTGSRAKLDGVDEDLRALARDAARDESARFKLHAILDRRFYPEAPPLTEVLEGEVVAFASKVADLLVIHDELGEVELARAIVAPTLGGDAIRWEWLDRPSGLVVVVREAGTVTLDGEGDRCFFAPYADDDDGVNTGERMLLLEPGSPAAAFVAWAREPGKRYLRASEEVALRWAHRLFARTDVGGFGQNTG